jgi:hypothetical protein
LLKRKGCLQAKGQRANYSKAFVKGLHDGKGTGKEGF